nr:hypothetical protein [Planctomycetota bacterium]
KDADGKNRVMGTPMYMSPEQARAQAVDHRSDQYSLGATLYHMLTGEAPFKGTDAKALMRAHVFDPIPDPRAIRPDVPEAWRQLAMKLLAKMPDDRFATAADMRAAVEGAATGISLQSLSKRVRTPMAKRPSGGVPTWAVLLVLVLVIAGSAAFLAMRGGKQKGSAEEATAGGTAGAVRTTPDPADVPSDDSAVVRAAIIALPKDDGQAIASLGRMANEASWSSPMAKAAIAKELKRRQDGLAAAQSNGMKAELALIDQHVADKDLVAARDGLTAFIGKHPDLGQSDVVKATNNRIEAALATMAKDFIDRAVAAPSGKELDGLAREAKAAALNPEALKVIDQQIAQRRAQLEKDASAQARAADRKVWDELAVALDEKRRALKFVEFRSVVDACLARMTADESKRLVEALGELGDLVSVGETAIKDYVARQQPIYDARLNEVPTKVKLIKFGLGTVSYIVMDKDSFSGTKSIERLKMSLPWRELIAASIVGQKADEAQRIKAACLWGWHAPEAREAIEVIAAQSIGKALKVLEVCLNAGLDLAGTVGRKGELVTVAYDYSTKDAHLISDWQGDGLSMGEHGLSWTTRKTCGPQPSRAGGGKRTEADLPEFVWKEALLPPFNAHAKVWLHPGTHLAMIGVAAGNRRVRLAMSNDRGNNHLGMVASTPDGASFEFSEADTHPFFSQTEALDIDLAVDPDGKVALMFNQVEPKMAMDLARLPPGIPVTLLIQAYQFDGSQTTFEIQSMELSGKGK